MECTVCTKTNYQDRSTVDPSRQINLLCISTILADRTGNQPKNSATYYYVFYGGKTGGIL
jgi:hypothetical protein